MEDFKTIPIPTGELSESDTRSKLIDPLFKDVLKWQENDIRREEPVNSGFVDYTLGLEYKYFHIEAKRLEPRFDVQSEQRARYYKISGPVLGNNKLLNENIHQSAKYSVDLGTEFSILSNGTQLVIFKTMTPGKKWTDGRAIVFHDLEDIKNSFQEFYELLSRDSVRSGSLKQKLSDADSLDLNLYVPRNSLHAKDVDLIRNEFWSKISTIFSPLLAGQPDDEALQDIIIQNCYVKTNYSDQADKFINNILEEDIPEYLKKAQVTNLKSGNQGKNAFEHGLTDDIKESKVRSYLLTGGVGSGKTTFLRRFVKVVAPSFVKEFCVWLHLDFLAFGNVEKDKISEDLKDYSFRKIRELLKTRYPDYLPKTPEEIRTIFSSEIEELKLTRLAGVLEGSQTWNEIINNRMEELFRNNFTFVTTVLKNIRKTGKRVVVVFDNTDQLGEELQESVFLFSQYLSKECFASAIVSLREERFFASFRRGKFDAYGDRRFHISSPDLKDVIRKRLEYGLSKYIEERKENPQEVEIVKKVIESMISSCTHKNQNIIRLLVCVSNDDMRLALSMFKDFISSGNTDFNKIVGKIEETGAYLVPFHEFTKSAILGAKKYYSSTASHTFNVFQRSPSSLSSHLTAPRILRRLTLIRETPSAYGAGYIESISLLEEYRSVFGDVKDFILKMEQLMLKGLVETEPPRAFAFKDTNAVRASAAGVYYWMYLIRSFAYLDLVLVDTPVADKSVFERLVTMIPQTDLTVRFERVRLFFEYLSTQEKTELSRIQTPESNFALALMNDLVVQIEKEISDIMKRTGMLKVETPEIL